MINDTTPSFHNHTQVCRRSDVLFAKVDGEMVLMTLDQAHYVGLNDTGSDVWKHIERPIAVEALVARLADEYDGDPTVIEREVRALLSEMAANGLVDLC
ncbi:PqqD family protein [Azospirillum sp.]|uniref:PqqD family protein n=1 Tax=Azospirillum sp. TaxID=34012 RepID=UPI002D5B2FD4|nr:PqqD family protein [Azospirillum sp.]HYD63940.1 PqqD family protein [Azospirillum sp.]